MLRDYVNLSGWRFRIWKRTKVFMVMIGESVRIIKRKDDIRLS